MESRLVVGASLCLAHIWVSFAQKLCPLLGDFDTQCSCQKKLISISPKHEWDKKLMQAIRSIKPGVTTMVEIKTMECPELEVMPALDPELVFGHLSGDIWVIQNSPLLNLIPSHSFYGVELQMLYFRNNSRLSSIQPLAFHGLSTKAVVIENTTPLTMGESSLSGVRPNCALTKQKPVIRVFPDYSLRRRFKRSPQQNCQLQFNITNHDRTAGSYPLLEGYARTCPFTQHNSHSKLPTTCASVTPRSERIYIVLDPSVSTPRLNYSSSGYFLFSHPTQHPTTLPVISVGFPSTLKQMRTEVALGYSFDWKIEPTSCNEDPYPKCYFKLHTSDSWTENGNCRVITSQNGTFRLHVEEEGLYTAILRRKSYDFEDLHFVSPTLLSIIAVPTVFALSIVLLITSIIIAHVKCPRSKKITINRVPRDESFIQCYAFLLFVQLRCIRGFTFCANRKLSPPSALFSDIAGLSLGLLAMSATPQLMWPIFCPGIPIRLLSIGIFPGDLLYCWIQLLVTFLGDVYLCHFAQKKPDASQSNHWLTKSSRALSWLMAITIIGSFGFTSVRTVQLGEAKTKEFFIVIGSSSAMYWMHQIIFFLSIALYRSRPTRQKAIRRPLSRDIIENDENQQIELNRRNSAG